MRIVNPLDCGGDPEMDLVDSDWKIIPGDGAGPGMHLKSAIEDSLTNCGVGEFVLATVAGPG